MKWGLTRYLCKSCVHVHVFTHACVCLLGERLGGSMCLLVYRQKRQDMGKTLNGKDNCTFE